MSVNSGSDYCIPVYFIGAPTGTMPFLEVGGVKYGQSLAIARFLARKFGKSCRAFSNAKFSE